MKKSSPEKTTAWKPLQDNNSKTMRGLICISLIAAVCIVYMQTLGHEFTNFDDNVYVTENDHVKAGLSSESVAWAFTTKRASNWHPLTWLSHMADYQLYGSDPAGHHLTSVLLHAANVLLLFMVLTRMTGALWQSAFVAALFAVHPLNVESVAWIAERKNVLSAFFWLLTMWAYVRYAERTSVARYLLTLMFFAMGLMAKPMLVTLPFVLLLLDYWPLQRWRPGKGKTGAGKSGNLARLIWEKTPFLALSVVSCVVTFAAQKGGGAVQSTEIYTLQVRIVNALVSYLEYLEKMVWPQNLAALYPHPGGSLPIWQGAVCAIALIFASTIAVKKIRQAPYLAVGWFWYLGTLVPVIGIVQVGAQAMADRYAYIPLIGIFIIVAWGVPALYKSGAWRNKAMAVSVGIIIPALMTVTWTQASHWQNSVALFKHAIAAVHSERPNFALVHLNLGYALGQQNKLDEAIFHYEEAIRLKPDYAKAHNNLGIAFSLKGKFKAAIARYKDVIKMIPKHAPAYNNLGMLFNEEKEFEKAIASFREAVRLKPRYATAHNNLGNALRRQGNYEETVIHYRNAIKHRPAYPEAHNNLGRSLAKLKKFAEAETYLKRAIKLDPGYADAYYNLGDVLRRQNKLKEAIKNFNMAIKLSPGSARAHNRLGEALMNTGKLPAAIDHLSQAVKIKPNYAEALNNLGVALLINGKTSEAIGPISKAILLDPDYATAHNSLGVALSLSGKPKEAILHYRDSIRLNPDDAEAHNNLGKALNQQKQTEEAIKHFREAIRLNPGYAQARANLKAALKADGGD